MPLIGNEAKTSQGGHRTRAPQSVEGNARHLREIEPVAHTQACLKSGGVRLVEKRPLYIGNDAIVVGVKAERTQWLIQSIEIGNDHRQRPEREHYKQTATCDVPITAHPVIIFHDLVKEANGLGRLRADLAIADHHRDVLCASRKPNRTTITPANCKAVGVSPSASHPTNSTNGGTSEGNTAARPAPSRWTD